MKLNFTSQVLIPAAIIISTRPDNVKSGADFIFRNKRAARVLRTCSEEKGIPDLCSIHCMKFRVEE